MNRMLYYVLDEEHRPVQEPSLLAWAHWISFMPNRVVDFTDITADVHVSTIFLGFDPAVVQRRGPPKLFETRIFGGPLDLDAWSYASWDDAVIGHKAAVRKARRAAGQQPHAEDSNA